ncbi:MAG: glucose-6-phosphate isomerase [Aeriscardovia sp.]|nr:glucose-6-phosphate isomerase [Aeriscardovia sp.]
MVIESPVDATKTRAWAELTQMYTDMHKKGIDLRRWFADEPNRARELSFDAGDLRIDLSKNLIQPSMVPIFAQLAEEVHLRERTEDMFAGKHINVTEDRAALHTALRRPESDIGSVVADGQDVVSDVHAMLQRVYAFADKVRSGEWTGVTGKRIETVVNIGIGGSDLGPVMAYEALKPYADAGISARFISNIDPNDIAEKTRGLDPQTTLFVVVSKTFTTVETITNATDARAWLLDSLTASGAIDGSEESRAEAVRRHFVAVSTALEKVKAFGIDPENTFGFWNWVGGRYSVDSAVGTVLTIVLGPRRFDDFLAGFHAMDKYFRTTPYEKNAVALMGLMNVWYADFFGAESHAVLPYNQYLHRFPAYLQQLTMESNGKSVRWDGTPARSKTGEIFWGEPGTNGQHSFYQLIHQGTHLIPADFIAFANTRNPLRCGDQDVQELLLSNFLAQTKALAFGKTADEVRAEGTPDVIVPARVFNGNRPTTSIFGDELTPYSLGELISLYEMIVFTEGTVWGIDSFDQWGVELGKILAKQISPALSQNDEALAAQDQSTRSLIEWYRVHRR